MRCMYKIAVLGDYDSIYGFAALGLSIFPAGSRERGAELFGQLTAGEYGIIYITEAMAGMLEEEIESCSGRMYPAVIRIPGISGNTGEGMAQVRKFVERAVGSDILSDD